MLKQYPLHYHFPTHIDFFNDSLIITNSKHIKKQCHISSHPNRCQKDIPTK